MAYILFQPHDYFNTKLFTANASTQSITGVGFQPDMVWGKSRGNAYDHEIYDAVRGVHKRIKPNQLHAEASDTGNLTSFDSDGFSLGSATNMNYTNGDNIVAWNWKAGTTSGISAGSQNITPSSYSINTSAGFGIYKWSRTGASTTDYFSHGLGATPTIALQKRTDDAQDWYVNTTAIDGSNDNLHLNKNEAKEDDSTTVATSTNYYPKSPETGDYITYLFAPIKGFSSFGSYKGTGNADGVFIYTGFKPAFVVVKLTSGADNWMAFTNKIGSQTDETGGHNIHNRLLELNGSGAEQSAGTGHGLDFCANGFKIREDNVNMNGSGSTYLYFAFAEEPLVSSNGVPATAG